MTASGLASSPASAANSGPLQRTTQGPPATHRRARSSRVGEASTKTGSSTQGLPCARNVATAEGTAPPALPLPPPLRVSRGDGGPPVRIERAEVHEKRVGAGREGGDLVRGD